MKKRIIILSALLFLTLTVVACSKKDTSFEDAVTYLKSTYTAQELKDDITLPINYTNEEGRTFVIDITSSNEDVLDANGTVHRGDNNVTVTLTYMVTYGDKSASFTVNYTVIALPTAQVALDQAETKIKAETSLICTSLDLTDYTIEIDGRTVNVSMACLGDCDSKIISQPIGHDSDAMIEYTLTCLDQTKTFELDFVLKGREATLEEVEQNIKEQLNLPSSTVSNVTLPNTLDVYGETVNLTYASSASSILSKRGACYPTDTNTDVTLTISYDYKGETYNLNQVITVLSYNTKEYANMLFASFHLPEEINDDISLPLGQDTATFTWTSNNTDVLKSDGTYLGGLTDTTVKLSCKCTLANGSFYYYTYTIVCLALDEAGYLRKTARTLDIPSSTDIDLILPQTLSDGITVSYTSGNPAILSNEGAIATLSTNQATTLTLTLKKGELTYSETFDITIKSRNRLVSTKSYQIYRAIDLASMTLEGVHKYGNKIVLDDGKTSGSVTSSEIKTSTTFINLIGSWASTSSTTNGACLEVRVKSSSGTWSKYFSYGSFYWGNHNACATGQSDSIAKLDQDTIVALNSNKFCAYQFRLTLSRTSTSVSTPYASLVAIDLWKNTTNTIDKSLIKDDVNYDVPKVNQNEVPSIGGSICSPTTSTMLLKWKGQNFKQYDTYENRYVAERVKDYGNDIYGNWVYNTVGMSSFGYDSYFLSFSTFEELQVYLSTTGPCGASIKGSTGLYTTNGHLICVTGYLTKNGSTYVRVNDPNINNRFTDATGNPLWVYYEYPLATFMGFWRGAVYVME